MRRLHRMRDVAIVAALSIATTSCGDHGPDKPNEPFGEYQLQSVAGKLVPYVSKTNLDGSYEEVVSGSLRFLSRGRFAAELLTLRKNADGTVREEIGDTVIFLYRRSVDIVDVEFQDPLGTKHDTLDVEDYFDQPALRARSNRYARAGAPAPLMAGAFYVKVQAEAFAPAKQTVPYSESGGTD